MNKKFVSRLFTMLAKFIIISTAILLVTCSTRSNTYEAMAANNTMSIGSWNPVESPITDNLRAVSMISASNGWAVGEDGVILQWNGNMWSTVPSPTANSLYAITMLSPSDGWAMGEYGVIIHWDGVSWTKVASPTSALLLSMDFLTPTEGWAVGFAQACPSGWKMMGTMLKWDGSEWATIVDNVDNFGYRTVEVLASDNVWVIGAYQDVTCDPLDIDGPKTLDIVHWNGSVWNNNVKGACNNWVNSLALMPDNTGWAGGPQCLLSFNNGEVSWIGAAPGTDYNLISIDIVTNNDVWAVGGAFADSEVMSFILHWDGTSWEVIPNPGMKYLFSVSMISANDGWAVGDAGTILRYATDQPVYKYVFIPIVARQ